MVERASSKNIRVYWLAFVVYWGILLFGYDAGIAGGVVSQPFFESQFGLVNPDGAIDKGKETEVSSNVVSVLQAGAFFGALGSAPVSDLLGRRRTLVILIVTFSIGAILTTVAGGSRGINYIYAGRVISGIGIGGISAVSPTYVSECSPKSARGRITGMFQIMVATGGMVSYFVNLGVGLHMANSENVWRVPFGLQLVPAGIMCLGLLTVKESPRWLASKGRTQEAIMNLAYFRREHHSSPEVRHEMAEIDATIREEHTVRKDLGQHEAFFGNGNFIRFVIAFLLFLLQQWSGQNSVAYYAPQIFSSIGYTGTKNSLLSSGIYGVVKVVATTVSVLFFVDTLGRRPSLFASAMGMGVMFFIVGAILKTHPVDNVLSNHTATPSSASKAMASMLYIYVCFYSMGVGPIPWIYVSEIFPTRTRHYGLAFASATQWLFNFVVAKVTPTLVADLGYKLFFVFAIIDIGGMAVFSVFLPETKGRSLEEMDIIFGAVSYEAREAFIKTQERELKAVGTRKSQFSIPSGHSATATSDLRTKWLITNSALRFLHQPYSMFRYKDTWKYIASLHNLNCFHPVPLKSSTKAKRMPKSARRKLTSKSPSRQRRAVKKGKHGMYRPGPLVKFLTPFTRGFDTSGRRNPIP